MKFLTLAATLTFAILGLIITVEFLSGLYPTVISTLTSVNNSGKVFNGSGYWTNTGYDVVPLRSLIASDGVIPLIIVAVAVIGIIVGLFALVKSKGSKR